MKRVVRVKLMPSPEQSLVLAHTLETINAAACEVARIAREEREFHKFGLRKHTYTQIRERYGLGSQVAQLVIMKVADAYRTHRSNLNNGHYGKRGTERRAKAESKVIVFRPHGAQAFDARVLSWKHEARTVSIWTTQGRMILRFVGRDTDLELLAANKIGEADLVERNGNWYLLATVTTADIEVAEPDGFVGVDMGIVTIAATEAVTNAGERIPKTDGDWSGGAVTRRRHTNRRQRQRLQTKGTKSAKRLLKKRARKEARFVTDVNHQISKQIVTEAQRTGRGIAVEDLVGIRARVRLRKPQRVTLHSWAFAQLGQFLAYKAEAAGVAFVDVNPAYTSQTCSVCARVDKKARVNQATYACTNNECGVSLNADHNAAINIARKGVSRWGDVNRPYAVAA